MCYLSSHTQTETKWSMLAVSQNYSMCSILYTALFVIPGYSVMVFPTKNRRSPPTKNPQNDPSGRTNRRGLRSADSSWLRAMHQSSHIPSLVSLVVLWPTSTIKSFPFHVRLPVILQHVLYDARLLKQFPSSDTWNVAQSHELANWHQKKASKNYQSAARGPFVRETYLFPLAGACSPQWLSSWTTNKANMFPLMFSSFLNAHNMAWPQAMFKTVIINATVCRTHSPTNQTFSAK